MSKTKMRAGLAVAAYVDDGQGRRLVIGAERASSGFVPTITLATTRVEARAAIAVLTQLAEELPPGEPEPRVIVTPVSAEGSR